MLALVLVVLAAPKSGASAPAKPTLPSQAAIFVSSPDEGPAAKAEADLTRALGDANVRLVDLLETYPEPEPDDTGAKLAKDARQSYDDLDYEGSAAKWKDAMAWFLKNPEATDPKLLADAHFFTGALAIQNGGKSQLKKGQEEFVRALLLNPDLTCDPQVYGADVKKAFDKAIAEIASKPTAKLTVESSPAGALVTFRGKELGHTPLADGPSVPVGRHHLVLSRPGYVTTGAFADVTKEGGSVKPTLKAIGGYDEVREAATTLIGKGVGVKGALPAGAKKLAEVIKARFLVLSDGATAEVWDVESGNRLTGLSMSGEELGATASKINGFVTKPLAVAAAAAAEPEVRAAAEPSAGGPVYTKWWFWTAVGVVAVGGATAAGVAAANNSGPRPFNVVLGIP